MHEHDTELEREERDRALRRFEPLRRPRPGARRSAPADTAGRPAADYAAAEPAAAEPDAAQPAPAEPDAEPADSTARTPPSPMLVPAAELARRTEHDLSAPEYFLNRELTWLSFNFRVLHEAADQRTPLLERVKFLSIVSSNLDEFFMKRIGGLKQQFGAGMQELTLDGRTPEQQIAACYGLVRELVDRRRRIMLDVLDALAANGIQVTSFAALSEGEQAQVRRDYLANIHPLLTPQATDPAHPFPFISNLSLNLLVSVRYPDETDVSVARIKVPVGAGVPRLWKLPDRTAFLRMEDVIAANLDVLFPDMEVVGVSLFRVTRNANTEKDEERADDLLAMIETELRDRRFAPIVRLEVDKDMEPQHRGMLAAELGLDEHADVFEVDGMLGMRDMMELCALPISALHDPPHHPLDHPEIKPDQSMFHVIRGVGSILLHHPYDSFSTSVERFLREASEDPKVRAIKMTLYRTSPGTKVINYLINAARNGKQVAVVVELKARFDEAANIHWANRLEEAGIHVTYGVVGLKTHCKVVLVVRQDYDGLRRYVHAGTGNYHAGTARLYTDLGLLTCEDTFGRDFTELFNYLTTGYRPKRRFEKILPAPKIMKPAILGKIAREIEKHTPESPGLIQFKTNALEDPDVTRALYLASQKGVRVDLIVRDSCRLLAGVPGLSENVRVISIVGRFLEHARVYYFKNGGAEDEYYIGSADVMRRNLESRVEVLVPIEVPAHREELRFLLDAQVNDKRSAWEMQPDGSYAQLRSAAGDDAEGSQQALMRWFDKRLRKATRLRRRRPHGPDRRNVRA